MALRTPPSWLQNGSHPAENDRLTTQSWISSTGIIGATSLQVTAQATPNMTVNVATGWCGILSSTANAGVYVAYNDATTVLAIATADPTLPRRDIVVATVSDAYYSGATNTVAFQVVAGTPNASPVAPATPSNSILLATIAVAAATTAISSANITDSRTSATSNLVSSVLSSGSFTSSLVTAVGTTSLAPLRFQSGTNLSTATGGAIEYDGAVAYLTPNISASNTTNGGRALLPARHFYGLSSDRSLTAGSASAQSMFGFGIALTASTTYEIEIVGHIFFTQSSVTSNAYSVILNFSSAPTASSGNALSGLAGATPINNILSASSFVAYTSTSATSQSVPFVLKGLIRTSAATTLTPQVKASGTNTSAFSMLNGSFVKITPVGSSSVTGIGAWA